MEFNNNDGGIPRKTHNGANGPNESFSPDKQPVRNETRADITNK